MVIASGSGLWSQTDNHCPATTNMARRTLRGGASRVCPEAGAERAGVHVVSFLYMRVCVSRPGCPPT